MKTRFRWLVGMAAFIGGIFVGFSLGSWRSDSSSASMPDSGDVSVADTYRAKLERKLENIASSESVTREVKEDTEANMLAALDELSRSSPSLVRRLDIHLFNHDFEVIPDDWALLGLPLEKADVLRSRLLDVFGKVSEAEGRSIVELSKSDGDVVLWSPPLSDDARAKYVGKIRDSFEDVFPKDLAEVLSGNYLDGNLTTTGALVGRGRILKIVPATQEEFEKTGIQYHINTQVLREGVNAEDGLANPAGNVYLNGDWPVFEIPPSWRHLVTDK